MNCDLLITNIWKRFNFEDSEDWRACLGAVLIGNLLLASPSALGCALFPVCLFFFAPKFAVITDLLAFLRAPDCNASY